MTMLKGMLREKRVISAENNNRENFGTLTLKLLYYYYYFMGFT